MRTFGKFCLVYALIMTLVTIGPAIPRNGNHGWEYPPGKTEAYWRLFGLYKIPAVKAYCSRYAEATYIAMVQDQPFKVDCRVRNEWMARELPKENL